MDTGSKSRSGWQTALPLLAALLLAGLLLASGRLALAAGSGDRAPLQGVPVSAPQADESASDLPGLQVGPPIFPSAPLTPTFDVQITKSRLPLTFTVGTSNKYFIDVTRTNTETINSTILVEDILPSGMSWTPTNSGKWDCSLSSSTTVSCYYTQANPTSFDTLVVNVNVSTSVAPIATNIAKILTVDANLANNVASVVTPVNSVDVSIKKSANLANVMEGQVVTYTMVITNGGPSTANWVVVAENLPAELTVDAVSWSWSGPGSGPSTVNWDATSNKWSIRSVLVGDIYTLRVGAKPTASAKGKQLSNTATVTSKEPDWNTANNSSTATILVGGLKISKSVVQTSVYVGQPISYTIYITNSGTTNASNVVLRDVLPAEIDFVSSSPSASYYASTRTVTYNKGTLPTGAAGRFALKIYARGNSTVTTARTVTNTASVTWGSPSLSLTSNGVPVDIIPAGMLNTSKTDGLTQVNPGQAISQTITIQNIGSLPIKAGSVFITDEFYNLTYTSINKGTVDLTELAPPASNQKKWQLNTAMGIGDSITFKLGFRVPTTATDGSITLNKVYVVFTDVEDHTLLGLPSQDQNTVVVPVVPVTNIRSEKLVHPIQAKVGESFTFRINVGNKGETAVSTVKIHDVFPAQLDLTSATTDRGTATLNTGTRAVDVTVSTLNPNEVVQIVVVAKVNTTVTTVKVLHNRATVSYVVASTTQSMYTPTAHFRVLPSSTLPVTGLDASTSTMLSPPEARTSLPATLLVVAGLLLVLIGLAVLAYGIWKRARHPLHAGFPVGLGLTLIAVGFFTSLAGWGIGLVGSSPQQLSQLQGWKPPLATHIALLPTSLAPQPSASPESGKPVAPTDTLLPTQNPDDVVPTATEGPTPTPLPTSTPGPTPDLSQYNPTATPAVLPDYQVPAPTAIPTIGPNGISPDSSSVTRIVIPAMGLDTDVKYVPYNGESWLIGGLKQEIAWMGDTSWPGLGGNTGLAGHVDLVTGAKGPFWNLSVLRIGDRVTLYTQKNIYTYEVREQKVVDDYDLSVVSQTTNPQITLITCTGWDNDLRVYIKRLVVYANLLGTQPIRSSQ